MVSGTQTPLKAVGTQHRSITSGDVVWALVVVLMTVLVGLALLAAPERALNYWYLLAAPLLTAAFRFGFLGAAVTSGVAVLIVAGAFREAGKNAVQAGHASQMLLDGRTSPDEVRELALQVANLREFNPELDLFRALTGVAVVVVGCILLGKSLDNRQRTASYLQRAFDLLRRYFSPQIVEAILSPEAKAGSGPTTSRREVTVLFADLRSFTPLSERLEPEETAALLNEYFSAMTEEIFREGGTLDKYLGDGLMAFFGDPIWFSDHPERACRTALAMQRRMRDLHTLWRSQNRETIEMGIGISTGYVVAGNTGSPSRMDYTVIGSTVNIAARLTDLAGPGEILATRKTYLRVRHSVEAEAKESVMVKGFANPVDIVEIRRARSEAEDVEGRETRRLTPLITRLVDDPSFRAELLSDIDEALRGENASESEQALLRQIAIASGYPHFLALPPGETASILTSGKIVRTEEALSIIQQGTPEDKFYVILEGDVTVTMRDARGQDVHVSSLGRGDYFGEVALLYDTLRTATVRTAGPVTLLTMDEDDFYQMLAVAPTFKEQVEATARERMAQPLPPRRVLRDGTVSVA